MYKIESIDHYGRGITKVDNKITFVENALPNEIVELNIYNEKKNYGEAKVSKYIETSKDRTKVLCPYYDYCGGCNIMHLNYENQLNFKQNKIRNIVDKYLDKNIKINNMVSSNNVLNYRNKATFHVDNKIGYYNDNSHRLIEIDNCLLCNEKINDSIKYLEKLDLKDISKITCRVSNELMIIIDTNNKDLNVDILKDIADSIYLHINNKYILVYGKEYINEKIGNYKFIISPDSFFQVNIDVCHKLYSKIKEYINKDESILDLYCGTGTIGIFVNNNNRIIGVEKNEYAIKDAIKNAKLNNMDNIEFICGDSSTKIDFIPDAVIVDPPRSGLNKETINHIINLNPKKIIYTSCDPMTLVRDLNILKDNYDILEITPFDMFPNTYHIESLCILKHK